MLMVDKKSRHFLSTVHIGERVGNPTVKRRQADGVQGMNTNIRNYYYHYFMLSRITLFVPFNAHWCAFIRVFRSCNHCSSC